MRREDAENLAGIFRAAASDAGVPRLSLFADGPLTGFHHWANGKASLGTFLLRGTGGEDLHLLLLTWHPPKPDEWYLVVFGKPSAGPIAELWRLRDGHLHWTYAPVKQDGRNAERKEAFRRLRGDVAVSIALPGSEADVDRFLDDLEALARVRRAADALPPAETDAAAPEAPRAWFLQANPAYYDIRGAVKTLRRLRWGLPQHAGRVRSGDRVYVWEAGAQGGIVAVARVAGPPGPGPDPDAERPFDKGERLWDAEAPSAEILIERVLEAPVARSALRTDGRLGDLAILRSARGTVFPVSAAEDAALQDLLSTRPQPRGPDFGDVVGALRDVGLQVSEETVATFLLALQAKRFVIMTGISGTGKTRIALEVARLFSARRGDAEPDAAPPPGGVGLEVRPYTLRYRRFLVPAALAPAVRATLDGGEASRLSLRLPDGSTHELSFGTYGPRHVEVYLKGAARAWFQANLQEGDPFFLTLSEEGDGASLVLSLPSAGVGAGTPEPCYAVVAVHPEWTDRRGLLGFYNPLTDSYQRTPFLDLLLRATREAERAAAGSRAPDPFFLLLDEMNLARVEHYFADFLSAMESGEPLHLHDSETAATGETPDGVAVPRQLRVPGNLFFVGTVNVDETTYQFSPKVLDRAFSLELTEVDLAAYGSEAEALEDDVPLRLVRFDGQLARGDAPPGLVDWDALAELEDGRLRDTVVEVNAVLASRGRQFGYRVANEIARFVVLAAEQTDGSPEALHDALDLALLQKALPKLHGTQHELETVLEGLLAVAGSHGLARTQRKVERMLERSRHQGYASFIE